MIAVCCDKCAEVFDVPESLAGREEACPRCKALAKVPEPTEVIEGIGREAANQSAADQGSLGKPYSLGIVKSNPGNFGATVCTILCVFSLVCAVFAGTVSSGTDHHVELGPVVGALVISGVGWLLAASLFSLVGRIVLAMERLSPPATRKG
jgi:phage FluMu protein Com